MRARKSKVLIRIFHNFRFIDKSFQLNEHLINLSSRFSFTSKKWTRKKKVHSGLAYRQIIHKAGSTRCSGETSTQTHNLKLLYWTSSRLKNTEMWLNFIGASLCLLHSVELKAMREMNFLLRFRSPQIYYIIKRHRKKKFHCFLCFDIEKFNMLCEKNVFYWIFMSFAIDWKKLLFFDFPFSPFFSPRLRQLLNNKAKCVINFISFWITFSSRRRAPRRAKDENFNGFGSEGFSMVLWNSIKFFNCFSFMTQWISIERKTKWSEMNSEVKINIRQLRIVALKSFARRKVKKIFN